MIYNQSRDDYLKHSDSDHDTKHDNLKHLPWISEGTDSGDSWNIASKPPQEIPSQQPQEIQPTPQELIQYHSADDQSIAE